MEMRIHDEGLLHVVGALLACWAEDDPDASASAAKPLGAIAGNPDD